VSIKRKRGGVKGEKSKGGIGRKDNKQVMEGGNNKEKLGKKGGKLDLGIVKGNGGVVGVGGIGGE
jgi:hypothetical protein